MKKYIILTVILISINLQAQKTFIDSQRRKITIEVPKRIVVVSPEAQEILFELGLGSRIVGNVKQCDYPKKARSIAKVGDFQNPNLEKIVKLKPDLIIVTGNVQQKLIHKLEKLNLPVFVLYIRSIIELNNFILMFGQMFDKQEQARICINKINTALQSLNNISEKNKVFPVLWGDPLMTCGSFTLVDAVITYAKGVNMARTIGKEYFNVDQEYLLRNKPDFLLICDKNIDIKASLPLVFSKHKDIIIINNIDPDLLLRAGPRIVQGIKLLNQALAQ